MKVNQNATLYISLALSAIAIVFMTILVAIYGWLPEAGTDLAVEVDHAFMFVVYASAVVFLLVVISMMYLMVKYRRKTMLDRSPLVEPNHNLERSWIVLPTILCLVCFVWGFRVFVKLGVAPPDSYEIYVTGQKWSWTFEYPNGVKTNHLFAVPVDRPVKLIMTSTDVLHSFFIPKYRVKHDVIPNRYSTVWFQANEVTPKDADGEIRDYVQVFCTEYCGTRHSNMFAELRVMSQKDFDAWVQFGGVNIDEMPLEDLGEYAYFNKTCAQCHSIDGTQLSGPTFKGLWGRQEQLTDGSSVDVDENYLRESILQPMEKIVAGYAPVMPLIELQEREVLALIKFIEAQQ